MSRRLQLWKRPAGTLLWCVLWVVLGSAFHAGVLRGADPPSEYQVKAAFLLNFTKFVEWPPEAFEGRDAPFRVCILGDDPFGGALDELVEGEANNGRRIVVERIRRAPQPKLCQVLFISGSEKDVPGTVAGAGPGVLTVSDSDEFLKNGGAIGFVLENRRVRFDISRSAAEKAGLRLSSRLLGVARHVQK